MPSYDYRCKACDYPFPVTMTLSELEKKPVKCPRCRSKRVQKVILKAPTVTFVGSGFYVNDKGK